MSRGVIAAPAIINIHGDGFTMERGLSSQEVRYYALYWDKVVIPGTNLVYVGLPEEDVLIASGVIERPRVSFQGAIGGADIGRSFAVAQAMTAKKLMNEDRSIDWVLHQIGDKLNLPLEFTESTNSLRFDLVNLLPVPSGSTPISEILEFKDRRADELSSLHNAIETAYIEALKCPDKNIGASTAIRELKHSIGHLEAVSTEKWGRTSKFDFSAQINLDGGKIAKGIASGAAFDFFTNLFTLPVGTIAGGLASMFRFKASYSSSFKPASNNSKLAFLSHAHEERIIE